MDLVTGTMIAEFASAAKIPAAAGIGLRFAHHELVIDERPAVDWFEVHAENYFGAGVATDFLLKIRETYPVSLHATALSLGSSDGVDTAHLTALAHLCKRIEPGLISDHLSWNALGAIQLPDLLPVPYTEEALEVIIRNVDQVQTALRRSVLLENPSIYYAIRDAEMSEGEFLAEVVRRTGCGVLLDINNVAVTAGNLGVPAAGRLRDILDRVPNPAIGEIHLAGHAIKLFDDGRFVRVDDHGSKVCEDTWSLYDLALQALGPKPALMEWDTDIPAFSVLQEEAFKAQGRLDAQLAAALRERPQHAAAV